ncbi:hypothetical protein DAEQUDRAFT_405822 [Daedalea quercina L-15889]|uniref:Uncharacterized protein n=1 Tax=Daedalea quercina L-15889 TaxID=1314783 RepID=A0A165NMU9_9APHY|nr:hypothetical protein DAEQUDRAFT_405822 [Daedalea quercina L-15889]
MSLITAALHSSRLHRRRCVLATCTATSLRSLPIRCMWIAMHISSATITSLVPVTPFHEAYHHAFTSPQTMCTPSSPR